MEMKLRDVFGEMILPKDTILYHTSDTLFKKDMKKKMLFCTFHPSEWEGLDHEYISFVRLLKHTKLLFMVSHFSKRRVISGLQIVAEQPNISNLSKQSHSFLMEIIPKLEKEGYDGWFSSIENKGYTEVALLNRDDVFKVEKTEKLVKRWRNSNNLHRIVLKNWGTNYPIGKTIVLNLPISYQTKIHTYQEYSSKARTPNDFVFEILLHNAIIHYF